MTRPLPLLAAALFATLGLAACDRPATVVVPAVVTVPVPGPAGPTGEAGPPGNPGAPRVQGNARKSGRSTTVIVVPPAASAPN